MKPYRVWTAALVVALALTGCKTYGPDCKRPPVPGGADAAGPPPEPPYVVCQGPLPELERIYFDYDAAEIRPDQVPALEANAAIIKQDGKMFRIQGHCDERGTQEYNLALGERRALAVRAYLIRLGCDGSKLVTISYGEEAPDDPGSGEAAWAKNRRAQFDIGDR